MLDKYLKYKLIIQIVNRPYVCIYFKGKVLYRPGCRIEHLER